tara:strand:- start:226 stop:1080 length:855 start_codon:yes stop_codon:yes gene_type:complete
MNKNAMSIFMMAGLVMSNAAVGDANDNEIFIAQTGNNVELTIQQIGAGNKYGGDDFSGTSIDMTMTVSDSYLDLLLDGDYNKMFGTISTTGSTINNFVTGNYNTWNQKIGVANTADTLSIDTAITGDTNSIVFRAGNADDAYNISTPLWNQSNAESFWTVSGTTWSRTASGQTAYWGSWSPTEGSADSLDMDLDVTGSDNIANIFVNSSNATFNWDITGSDNWIQTTMEDGSDNRQTVDVTGDYNFIFVGQDTGSTTGVTNNAILDASFTTTHSDINIIQSDAN